jgi:hypothetical protein
LPVCADKTCDKEKRGIKRKRRKDVFKVFKLLYGRYDSNAKKVGLLK